MMKITISLLALVLVLLLLAIFWKGQNPAEHFLDCKNPDDMIDDISLTTQEYNELHNRCVELKALPNVEDPNVDMNEAENKCRTSCYANFMLRKKPVCAEECKDANSDQCKDCVNDFACQISKGNEIPLPCSSAVGSSGVRGLVIAKRDPDAEDALARAEQSL